MPTRSPKLPGTKIMINAIGMASCTMLRAAWRIHQVSVVVSNNTQER
jgi:hypothetical protein